MVTPPKPKNENHGGEGVRLNVEILDPDGKKMVKLKKKWKTKNCSNHCEVCYVAIKTPGKVVRSNPTAF